MYGSSMKTILILLIFFPWIVSAQPSGKITGCVQDESGGKLPGVRVEITGSKKILTFTNEQGCFAVPLSPGTYQVDFQLPGFNPSSKNDVVVYEGRDAIVDRTMRI